MTMTRRALMTAALASSSLVSRSLGAAGAAHAQESAVPQLPRFAYRDVVARARDLATAPFAPAAALPDELTKLNAAVWQNIRFRPDRALFADSGGAFRMQLFHLGGPYRRSATVNTIREGIATPIPYEANLFDYGQARFDKPLPINLGFAGLRIHYPINESRVFDEVIAFLGASYFRFLGRGQRYGLSARGLAVNAGYQNEEFPFFREFWVQTPTADADNITLYALLDSESVTGAYQFVFSPKAQSLLDVSTSLFARKSGQKIGWAPLTSMFCTGENDRRIHDDYRPERHDSDGLSMHTGAGEWIWRPLRNPAVPELSTFLDHDIGGFGLLQRDRNFEHYQDVSQLYELHPSYWIVPQGSWGDGKVELVELPTADENNDNIVASWVPNEGLEPGKPREFGYTITASRDTPDPSPNGRVANTFESAGREDGALEQPTPGSKRFLVDFAGGDLSYFLADPSLVSVVPTAVNGKILRSFLTPNARAGGFRAGLDVLVASGQSCDLRLFLRSETRALTETWTLPWKAN